MRRRGAIYIVTLGMTLIVATLAMAGLLAVRAQRYRSELSTHMLQARLNAQSGLEKALLEIAETDTWRSDFAAGSPAVIGPFDFTAIDPGDGDLEDDPLDLVLITATGLSGPATQKIEALLKARQPGLRCLEPVIHSNGDVIFRSTTVVGDRQVSSNKKVKAELASQIYIDAEAKDAVEAKDGSVYHGSTTTEGDWPREMPDKGTVLDYYLNNGTPIAFADLPLWGAEQIVNPDMGDGTTGWDDYLCTLAVDAEASQTPGSILVVGRLLASAGPYQLVTDAIQSGETYTLSVDLKAVGGAVKWEFVDGKLMTEPIESVGPIGGSMNMRIELWVDSSEAFPQCFPISWTEVGFSDFVTVTGNVTPTWTGSLDWSSFKVVSESANNNFKIDDASLTVANTPADSRVLHRTVLSPTTNPYGAGVTNPQGIYVIDASGGKIVVKDCRIVGTLVLIGQNEPDSRIRGSINWEPAVFWDDPSVPNLPILLSDKELRFDMSASDLSEELININFNPPGVPYSGSEDSDKADVYPSIFKGIVYTKKKVYVESDFRIHGALVAHDGMEFTAGNVNATYEPVYYWYNAPPGFQVDLVMEIVPGSFRRVVDQ